MPTQLREATRKARKTHRCGMCDAIIGVGHEHHVSTNVFDDRLYDFRTCQLCQSDRIVSTVYAWAGGPDEGVTVEDAWEWAHEVREQDPAAQAWLARNGCTCERCTTGGEQG